MRTVLHLLPHPGGGGERYIDLLEPIDGYIQERTWLSARRTAIAGAPSIVARWPAIARAARRHDLLHLHGDMTAMISLSLARRKPTVISTHGLSFLRRADGRALSLAEARWRQVVLAVRRVICSSETERDELLALSPPGTEARLTVVRNGIAPVEPTTTETRHAARAALGLEQADVVCLYLGFLDRYKDPLTAVGAVEIAHRRGAPVTLLVAGDGPLRAQVAGRAGATVRVLGFREDAESLLAAADVFVMPSAREGSSYALLEAMGRGLAVVGSDGAGVAEMVGKAGAVAPVGDVEALGALVYELALDPERRSVLGSAARARIAKRYTLAGFLAGVRQVYDEVLEA
jgi:glycosyltransferase involved in cell wall biosynthesis